jgi:hypothetical protein
MKQIDGYAELRRLGGPAIRTNEAAALWRTGEGTARRRLRSGLKTAARSATQA